MSLLIWAPMGTNSPYYSSSVPEQIGISPVEFQYLNNNGALVYRGYDGKVSMYYRSREYSAKADLYRTSAKLPALSTLTMCCWAYVVETIGDTANGLITNHSHADNSGLGITVKQVSTSDYRISCSTGNGSARTYNTYYGTTNIKNKWCHLALTYDGTNVRLYVNGVLEKTQAYGNKAISDYFDIFNWSTTHYTNADYRPKCKLQDVRLYDNVISQKELRELAHGLAVHIPCNQPSRSPNVFNINNLSSYTTYNTNPTVSGNDFTTTFNTSYTGNFIAIKTGYSFSAAQYTFSGYIRVNGHIPKSKYLTGAMSTYGSSVTATDYDPISGFFRITQNMPSGTTWDIHCPTARASGAADVVTFSNFKIELGNDPVPCWSPFDESYTEETDTSGFRNNGYSLSSSSLPQYYGDIKHGPSYHFKPSDYLVLCEYASFISDCTISFWAKFNTLGSSGFLPIAGGSGKGNSYIMASSAGTGNFYNGSDTTADGTKYYVDGAETTKPIKDSNWHHYCITGIKLNSWQSIYLNLYSATNSSWNSDIYYSDIRIYTTKFSDADCKNLTGASISITRHGLLMTQGELVERRMTNLIEQVNDSVIAQTQSNGLSSYTQANCSVSITADGFRIYRPPNLTVAANGNTMWGGLRLQIINYLVKGRTYIIMFDVSGASTNNATSWGFSNNMGWSGGGLEPNPSDVSSCNIGTNFIGQKTVWYKFTINDDLYKKCTASYSSFVKDTSYPSYRDFMFGFGYESTGSQGTNLYLTNFRLYDITGGRINPSFTKNGMIDVADSWFRCSPNIGKFGNIGSQHFVEY